MPTTVRSFSKINLGLAIGPLREDGFHALTTLYQTIAAHDLVTVTAEALAGGTNRIALTSNDRRVPLDARNTVWKMLERALALEPFAPRSWAVRVHIEKRLPIQGGLGAGSANAAAALVGLEQETGLAVSGPERLRLAAEVGSDVPLFLIGGAVLGQGRGEQVTPVPDIVPRDVPRDVPQDILQDAPQDALQYGGFEVVLALPEIAVSTPQAFRDWDAHVVFGDKGLGGLTPRHASGRLEELSRALAMALCEPHCSSGVFPAIGREGLARHPLSALVRTGIENDFEEVVFRQHPFLGTIKDALLARVKPGSSLPIGEEPLYAALSGSGSALFGLYQDAESAAAAELRLAALGVRTLRTHMLGRQAYWERMLLPAGQADRFSGSCQV